MVKIENSFFSGFDHIGIVVNDINKAVEFLESLGIGPFESGKGAGVVESIYYGEVVSGMKWENRKAQMGPVRLELLQPVAGQSPWKDFLKAKGEGINHIAFYVNDLNELNKELAKLERKGMKVIYRSKFKDGGGSAYVDTGKVGGLLFELHTLPAPKLTK